MQLKLLAAAASLLLSGCAGEIAMRAAATPVDVKIIAFNDFHGNLQPPKQSIDVPLPAGGSAKVPAGGAVYLASAIDDLRADNPYHVVVSAGDMIGASPLISALFLDEPTILAMNLIRVDFNAVGNHEFDRGRHELLRMQKGGCERHTAREPCQLDPTFPGAHSTFLAANTITENGSTLFPSYAIRNFGHGTERVSVGFIGMTLKATPAAVTPAGVAGLSFRDEAETANALVPKLREGGADAIVVVIHQGLSVDAGLSDQSCDGMDGELLPILERLDPAIDVVVSGHTHAAYVCNYGRINPTRPFLVTSAGQYGTLLTDITLTIDPRTKKVTRKVADNIIVQGESYTGSSGEITLSDHYPQYTANAAVVALIERYAAAAGPLAARVVGHLTAPADRNVTPSREHSLGNLIADAQLAATRSPEAGGARIAFMNPGGIRADLVPAADGSITYGQIFAAQPFGNSLVVKSLTGRQIRAVLEQQFGGGNSVDAPRILLVSNTLRYGYDLSLPPGARIIDPKIAGAPLEDDAIYRVTMNSFLASGGDNFTVFRDGTDPLGGPQDIDALEAYLKASNPLIPPTPNRIADLTPK